jgi:uncharacterized protein involved in exopolysaccharide biosynthesis
MQQPILQQSNTDSKSTPIDYYRIVANNRMLILVITLCAIVAATVYSYFLPNIYTAKAMIVPLQEDKNPISAIAGQLGGIAGLAGGSLGGSTQADLYTTMLRSETVKDVLIDRYGLMNVYKATLRSAAYQILDKNSLIIANKKDGVITISVEDKDPKRAADLANAYIDALANMAVNLNVSGAGKNRIFIEERLAKAKADLVHAEDDLKQFQAKNKTLDVPAQSRISIDSIARLKAELATQEVILATLRMKFTDSNQNIRTTNAAIGKLKAQIENVENGENGDPIPAVGTVPLLGQQYIRLMREFKMHESLVELLTKQFEMAQLTESKDLSPFQIIQKARIPDSKSKPNKALIVFAISVTVFLLSVLSVVVHSVWFQQSNPSE